MSHVIGDHRAGLWRRLIGHVPAVLVVLMLAGLGYCGHRWEWKVPKLSALTGSGVKEADDWCEEHGVPESQCVECRPELLPRAKDFGWCKEHGVADCPLCHPEVVQSKAAPVLTAADRERAARAASLAPGPENNPICKNYRRRIQFASLEAVKKAGVEVALVQRRPVRESLSATGEITYDQTRLASLASRLPGAAWRVEKNVGDRVRAGDVLALIDAAEVGRAKAEFIRALAEEDLRRKFAGRLEPASAQGAVPQRRLEEAQAEFVESQARLLGAQQALANLGLPVNVEELRGLPVERVARRLRFAGLPGPVVERLGTSETTSNLLPLTAPLDGVVVTRQVVTGEVVDAQRVLFQVADTSRMWLRLNVPADEVRKLSPGLVVRFLPDGAPGEVQGKLAWISTATDPQTRMVAVRAEVSNPHGELRNETFGTGQVVLREEPAAIAVPNEAVHWEGCCHVVFVRDKGYFERKTSPKVFHVRPVRLGTRTERFTEILAGVLPGEVVAAAGSDVLRAELLKNNLGEGCCDGK
jgi:membrane fusion protein, heavy metal efflux system